VEGPRGEKRVYRAAGVSDADAREYEAGRKGETRLMDCMDCHNRPSHPFTATAEEAVDEAIGLGRIDKGLPYIRRQIVAALKQEYPSQDVAAEAIARNVRDFYRTQYGAGSGLQAAALPYGALRPKLDAAIAITENLYRRNVFPTMKVTWSTYANNIGHTDFPGCFRCHDENHSTSDGKTIPQDCERCHEMLGVGR